MTGNPPNYDPSNLTGKYILRYRKPVPCPELKRWGKYFQRAHRRVRYTQIGDRSISTVFLGLDHNFTGGESVLFETMTMPDMDIQFRCSTWREALAQHWEVVRSVKAKQKWQK